MGAEENHDTESEMVENLVDRLVDRIIADTATNENMREWYVYSLLHIIETLVSCVTVLMIGFFSGQTLQMCLFLIFFLLLRNRSGGFHCGSFKNCYFGTIICVVVVEVTESILREHEIIMQLLFLLAVLIIGIIGALNHPNIDMNYEEFVSAKRSARTVLLIEAVIIAVWEALSGYGSFTDYMMLAVILNAVLILIGKINNQEVTKYEQ